MVILVNLQIFSNCQEFCINVWNFKIILEEFVSLSFPAISFDQLRTEFRFKFSDHPNCKIIY